MKRICLYITMLLVFLTVLSCKKEYKAPGPVATKAFMVAPITTSQINTPVYLADLSSDVRARTWTFPAQNVDILGSDNDRTSDKSTVAAVFSEPGLYIVNLHVDFNKPLIDNDELNGQSSVDTNFYITITDSVRAYFTAQYLDVEGNDSTEMDSSITNKLMGGEYVRYTSTRYGNSQDYFWYFEGGNPETYEGNDTTVVVQYPSLGNFGVYHVAYRNDPFSIDTVWYPSFIEVTPSTRPAQVTEAQKIDNTTIEITFSQNVLDPSDEVDNFNVIVKHEDFIPVEVVALKSHPSAQHKILVTLDTYLYDDDTISISYSPGNFANAYGGVVAPINAYPVAHNLESALPEYFDGGFENNPLSWVDGGWETTYAEGYYTVSRETDPEYVHSGQSSLHVLLEAGDHNMALSPIDPDDVAIPFIDDQWYRFSFWYYSPEPGYNCSIGVWVTFNISNSWYTDRATTGWTEAVYLTRGNGTDSPFFLRGVSLHEENIDVHIWVDDIRYDYFEPRPVTK